MLEGDEKSHITTSRNKEELNQREEFKRNPRSELEDLVDEYWDVVTV